MANNITNVKDKYTTVEHLGVLHDYNQNTYPKKTDVENNLKKKIDINQGTENTGKILTVDDSGNAVPSLYAKEVLNIDYTEENGEGYLEFSTDEKLTDNIIIDPTLTKEGHAADAKSTGDGINERIASSRIVNNFTTTEEGYVADGRALKTLLDKITELNGNLANVFADNAGAHNSIYRGKYLGDYVTAEQWQVIKNGTFKDLYIGDYWTIGGVNYRIAAFDYYWMTGDKVCAYHHVVIVPDTQLATSCMNDTNTTDGAYVGSKMYTEGLDVAKTIIANAFGSDHLMSHRQYLHNAANNGYTTGGEWCDSTVELMCEQNVFGCKIHGDSVNGTAHSNGRTIDNSQYRLFAFRHDMISNNRAYWLRDVASSESYCFVNLNGVSNYNSASIVMNIRPAFSIYQA